MDDSKFKVWLIKILKNKYILTGIIFVLWITFVDFNSLIDRYKSVKYLNQLKKDKAYYIKSIKEDKQRLIELQTNKENLEKFAREQFLMKKPNEDVIVIVEE